MENKELIDWIERWNPYNQHLTLSTIFAKMRFKNSHLSVINHGNPGSGKSRSTLELIKALNLGSEIIIDNTTTDRGLFEFFLNYPEQDIVLDECSTLLRSHKTQDMIKLAIEGKPLTWMKSGRIETTDPYQGNLIVNANVEIDDAVVDRCLLNKTAMNREMTVGFNKYFLKEYTAPTDFTPFIQYLRKTITSQAEPTLTQAEIETVFDIVQRALGEADSHGWFSRRIVIRELEYFRHMKKLFGSLDKEVFEYAAHYGETYIVNMHTPGLIESILGDGEVEKAELVRRVSYEGRYTEQHARRLINKAIDGKKIELRGKMVRKTNKVPLQLYKSNITNQDKSNIEKNGGHHHERRKLGEKKNKYP